MSKPKTQASTAVSPCRIHIMDLENGDLQQLHSDSSFQPLAVQCPRAAEVRGGGGRKEGTLPVT